MLKISTISGLILIFSFVQSRADTIDDVAALSLAEAKALAKRSNPTLRAAQERLYQAELIIDKAWTMVKPQWSATGTYTHHNTGMDLTYPDVTSIGTSEAVCGPFWNPDVGFCFTEFDTRVLQKQDSFNFFSQITQPIFLARAISTIKSAYQSYDLAKISTENAQDYLLYTLEVAYYGALTARKFVEIADNAVSIRQEHLRVARTKFEGGETPKITVLSAEISLNRAEQDKKSAENSLALSKESIMLLIGQRREFTLVQPVTPKQPSESLQEFTEKAKNQRRDLTAARLNLELAEEMEKDAWYRFLPSLVATGNLVVSDVKGFTNEYVTWSVGLALSIPIYDGGLRYSYLQEAKSKIREANIQIDQTRQNITSEIRQLWLRLEMAEANLSKSRHSLELAREQVELAKVSFDAGATTNLEVLDANSVLFVSEINVAQEELNLQLAILRLQRSLSMYNPAGAFTTGATSLPMGTTRSASGY
jgi:outer membrane protein, multidrug efflux system